jgi:tetratricopeptide (TPR) repeat protein
MRKNAWLLGLCVGCGVVLSVVVARRLERADEARALEARSLRLLRAPLQDAPSLRDLRAREARELLEQAQELSAEPARDLLVTEARSIELLTRGELARATQLLAEPRQHAPRLRAIAAAAALARGEANIAQAELAQLPGALQAEPRLLLLRSDIARALGRADLALAAAQSGVERHGELAPFFERRGLAHELLGDHNLAQADLERAADLDRRSTGALLALGRLQRNAGALSPAILAFQAALQRNPNEGEAWLGSGVCRQAIGDYVAARIELERAADLQPTRAEPLIALADLDIAEKNLNAALRRYRAAVLLDPNSALGHVKLGNALMRAGAAPQALPQFQAAIAQRPDLAAAHNGLGAALVAQGDLAGAETALHAATRLDPADAHPWLNLARLYKRRGDGAAESAALSAAQERDPRGAVRAAPVASANTAN